VRRWLAVALVGLAIAVAVPVAWRATRPGAAGTPVDLAVPGARPSEPDGSESGPEPAATGETPATHSAGLPLSTRPARAAVNDRAGRARLSVPSLGIDAPIVAVGVQPDGSMAIPTAVQDVGWYEFGPEPGSSIGSAVLAGHVDSAKQGKGALFALRTVGIGSRITVTLSSGRTVRYQVTGRELFVKKRLPTERLFARDGPPRLVIITCGGPFIRALSSYQDNLVVAAEPL
jgi:sortase (surface protein transpeptidase)